jgi:hypothetical protein
VKPSLAIWRTSRSHHRTANLSASGRKTMPQVSSLVGRCSGGKLIPARLQYCLTFAAKRVMAARSPTIIFKLLARLRPGRERRRGAVVTVKPRQAASERIMSDDPQKNTPEHENRIRGRACHLWEARHTVPTMKPERDHARVAWADGVTRRDTRLC